MAKRPSGKARARKARPPKPPHNAKRPRSFGTIAEIAQAIGAEPRSAVIAGQEIVLSQAERLCRLTVDGALGGSISDLKLLIREMANHPALLSDLQEQWVLLLAGADVDL